MPELSVVIPVFDDEEVLPELFSRLSTVLESSFSDYEIVFIDDGSSDNSLNILKDLQKKYKQILIVKLRENYGQSNAIAAGLENANGENIVVMDSDLQDKPEDIPILSEALRSSNTEMVIARWTESNITFCKQFISASFVLFSNSITTIQQPLNLGVFRIFTRKALNKVMLKKIVSGTILSRFYSSDISYRTIDLQRDKRFAGKTGYNFKKLIELALNRILPNLKLPKVNLRRDPEFIIEKIYGKKP